MTSTVQSLIQTNARLLHQVLELIGRLDDFTYASAPSGYEPHKAGSHLRHVLDFYECLLNGLAKASYIDYDARRRDSSIESSPGAAADKISWILQAFESLPAEECSLMVRPEAWDGETTLPSSLSRELLFLSSHTIHHFALIGMTLRAHGVGVDPGFGMAPSTVRHQQSSRASEAA